MNVEETVTNTASSAATIAATITAAADTLLVAIPVVGSGGSAGSEWSVSAGWTAASTLSTRQNPVVFWKYNDTAGDVTFSATNKDGDGNDDDFTEAALHLIEVSGAQFIGFDVNRNYNQYADDTKIYGIWDISREGNIGILTAWVNLVGAEITPPTGFSTCAETDGTGWSLVTYWSALPYASSYLVNATASTTCQWYSVSAECDATITQSPLLGGDF